ncbi:MAG: hypothetical protein U5K75_04575 [Ahrensia sp.]|nr:hypothetical protein [Ahrensia sp.]
MEKAIPVIIVGFTDFLLMLGMVHFAFDVPIRGSFILLLVLAFGYLLVELGKGLVISVMSNTAPGIPARRALVGMVDCVHGLRRSRGKYAAGSAMVCEHHPAHHWLTILRGIALKVRVWMCSGSTCWRWQSLEL